MKIPRNTTLHVKINADTTEIEAAFARIQQKADELNKTARTVGRCLRARRRRERLAAALRALPWLYVAGGAVLVAAAALTIGLGR